MGTLQPLVKYLVNVVKLCVISSLDLNDPTESTRNASNLIKMGEIIWLDVLIIRIPRCPYNKDGVLKMRTPRCPYNEDVLFR